MKKIWIVFLLTNCFITNIAKAENEPSCQAVLCLYGEVMGEKEANCSMSITTYFSKKAFTPHYNPTLTSILRENYLKQCSSADQNFIDLITKTFGRMRHGI